MRIAREAALGLTAAHKLGIVHRDIKPANLWLESPNGRLKLLDFGLARPDGMDSELTKSGVLIGTPAFMSPEQALGERVDHRTDLFSLGAVLYWLCTGQLPFQGSNVVAMLKALSTAEPKSVLALNPRLPGPLAELIHRLLAKTPEGRPQTATEVANRLQELLQHSAGLSPAMQGGGTAPAGAEGGDADPWTTLARSAASQQAGAAPMVPGEPKLLRSMRVVAITPMTEESQEQQQKKEEPATGPLRTVISSGILWEEVEEGKEEAKRPNPLTRRVMAEEEEEEREAKRPSRPMRRSGRRAKGTNGSAVALFIGAGVVVLVTAFVTVAMIIAGRAKTTESAQPKSGDRAAETLGGPEPPPSRKEFEEGGKVDLLALVDPKKHAVAGNWKKEGGALVVQKGGAKIPALQLPYEPGEEYDVEVAFRRLAESEGREGLQLVLNAGGRPVMVAVDGWPPFGFRSGLHYVDGKEGRDNETTVKGQLLKSNTDYTLVYSVRKDTINVSLNGKEIISFKGNFSRLSSDSPHPNKKALAFTTVPNDSFVVNRIVVTPVKGEGKITGGVEPTPAEVSSDPTGLIGSWAGPVEGGRLTEVWTVRCVDGKWEVTAVYLEGTKEVGSFVGLDVKLSGGTLTFVERFVKKPPGVIWGNNPAIAAKLVGDKFTYTWWVGGLSGSRDLTRWER